MTGEPKTVAIAANAALAASTAMTWSGVSFFTRRTATITRPPHEGDQRGFRSQHQAQAESGQRGQQDARQLGGLGRAGLDPLVGDVPAAAGQADDRDGGRHARATAAPAAATTRGPV